MSVGRVRAALAAVAILGLGASSASAQAASAPPVTFTRDVAPILHKHCVECHRPTMFAPMSLVTFEDARPWARAIRQRVADRTMPPWNADPAYGRFANDPRLSEAEIKTIVDWVTAGAPKGDDRDMPVPPTFAEGWSIGEPDAIFEMAEPFSIPASGEIPYQYMRIPTGIAEDRWIQALEIKPGSRPHVHHVIAFTQPAGEPPSSRGLFGPGNIGGVTPNKPGVTYPEGVARLLRGGSDIILQMHYTTNGTAAVDRTQVAVIWAKQPPAKIPRGGLVLDSRFVIPPGAPNHEVRASQVLQQDSLLTTMTPHMHSRGKSMKYIAHLPDGTSEVLLSVPNYDFNWQHTYRLAEPRLLTKGTRLEVIATFDNSAANKSNPDPTQEVRWGDQTWEEMMIGFWGGLADRPEATRQQR